MADNKSPIDVPRDDYAEFARKMDLLENGPTTTLREQLIAGGVELPEPSAIDDMDIRRRLWQVIAALAQLRVFVDHTDQMTDRQLYTALWANHLHLEVPAAEMGFHTHLDMLSCADEEHPAHDRDRLLPRPDYEEGPEALAWLCANPSPSAFASNRFASTQSAAAFIEQLYSAGATKIIIDNIQLLPGDDWLPYADTLMVTLAEPGTTRRAVMDLIEEVGRPDENSAAPWEVSGPNIVRLWWD